MHTELNLKKETSKIKILCNYNIDHIPEAKKILESVGAVTYGNYKYKQLLQVIETYDAMSPSLNIKLDSKLLKRAKKLKIIATPSTGTDHIDIKTAEELGIKVLSLKNDIRFLKGITGTAEHAFGLLLSIIRKVPFAFESVKTGDWQSKKFRGHELQGKVLGIIGYGRLGEMISGYANAFRMHIMAHDPYKKIKDGWVKQVDFDTLLHSSDIISLHVHLNEKTRGLISGREFSLMKDGVYIVNTSRGAIVDEAAFIKALKSGKIAGAAVDVITGEFDGEHKSNPLIKYAKEHNNLIVTPHIGGVTYESQAKAYSYTARKIQKFFKNKEIVS